MKSISQLGSYIIPFSRREIRSPKGNFKGGKNKYTQNVLLPTPKKEWGYFIIITIFFVFFFLVFCYNREDFRTVWAISAVDSRTHTHTPKLISFPVFSSSFSPPLFFFSLSLSRLLVFLSRLAWICWVGRNRSAHSQLTVLSRGPKSLLHTFWSWELLNTFRYFFFFFFQKIHLYWCVCVQGYYTIIVAHLWWFISFLPFLIFSRFNFLWNLFASQKRQEETKTRNKLMVV